MRFPIALLGFFVWSASLAAAEAPAPQGPTASAPADSKTEDSNLVIAPKNGAQEQDAKPGTWTSEPKAAPVSGRKPGEPIVSGEGQLIIGPKLVAAPAAQGDGAKPAVLPAAPQNNTPPANGNQPQPQQGDYRVPVLRLPIMFPSTSISSAGGPNMNFQVTGDAKLETREIVAPLPIGSYGPYLSPYSLPYAYGAAKPAGAPDKVPAPAK